MPAALWLPFQISIETGLRVGDVVALKASAVKSDGIHFKAQKTGKKGVAKISAALRRALPKGSGYLFPSPRDPSQHITRQALWGRVKRAAKSAGVDLDGVSPHSFRKSFAVELYKDKGFAAVQSALQHANAATTELYAFSDFTAVENADAPLTRGDLPLIVRMVLEAIGDRLLPIEKEAKKRRGN